jgi:exoribonuclease-2
MPRAGLQTNPAPHHGVGAEAYVRLDEACHRYADLLMHQQIIGFLDGGRAPFGEEDVKQALYYTAAARDAAREIANAARRYWLLRYLEGMVGQECAAVILESYAGNYLVELEETRLRSLAPATALVNLAPGTSVRVRLTRVSARADALRTASPALSR